MDTSSNSAKRLAYLKNISPRPILLITDKHAHSRNFSEGVYNDAEEPKELYTFPGARHIDLFDRTDLIPFDKLETFLTDINVKEMHHERYYALRSPRRAL
jgi:fermentation-respiration switch protein FrsA (DUF1100 family)